MFVGRVSRLFICSVFGELPIKVMAHRDLVVDSSSRVLSEQLSKWALALSPSSLPLRGPWVHL